MRKYKKGVALFMKRLYDTGLTTCSGGNISLCAGNKVYITPSAIDKANIKPCKIGILCLNGINLTKKLKPSIEAEMHLEIYKKRPDIKAIIHAHPPYATSFTAMDKSINFSLIAEARAILGEPGFAPYALMGTPELAKIVSEVSKDTNVILMENHGVLTVGISLLQAFDRIEVLEAAAKMTINTSLMNSEKELDIEKLNEIDELMKS
jgi:L-fuculose-phosphate aldolase